MQWRNLWTWVHTQPIKMYLSNPTTRPGEGGGKMPKNAIILGSLYWLSFKSKNLKLTNTYKEFFPTHRKTKKRLRIQNPKTNQKDESENRIRKNGTVWVSRDEASFEHISRFLSSPEDTNPNDTDVKWKTEKYKKVVIINKIKMAAGDFAFGIKKLI